MPNLTRRELDIFRMTGEGMIAEDMIEHLGINDKTIATYKGRIRDKLGVNMRRFRRLAFEYAADCRNLDRGLNGR